MAPRIENFAVWRHRILRRLDVEQARSSDPALVTLLAELKLEAFLPANVTTANVLYQLDGNAKGVHRYELTAESLPGFREFQAVSAKSFPTLAERT
jgi:hypothetical protein